MKEWRAGEIIGTISGSAFALTIVYLYSYQTTSHFDLFAHFDVNDYFRFAVAWLTPVAICWLIGFLVECATRRSEYRMPGQEIRNGTAKGPHARFWGTFREGAVRVAFVMASLTVVGDTILLLFGRIPQPVYYINMSFAAPIMWFAAVKWYESEKQLFSDWSNTWRAWVWFFPAALIFSFFIGASTAERAITPLRKANAAIVFIVGRPDPAVGRILFTLDDYILLRTSKSMELEAIPKG